MNFLILALAALIPMVIGFIWYNPKVFGTAWMEAADMTEEKMKGANMPVVFILSYVLSFLLAIAINQMVIHQAHIYSILMNEPGFGEEGTEIMIYVEDFMSKYGRNFRTFKHGAFHGVLGGLFIALPVLGTNAMFERKGFKYIAVNVGYWVVTFTLMGGVICEFA